MLWALVAAAGFLAWGYYLEQRSRVDQAAYVMEIEQKTQAVCEQYQLSQGLCTAK